MRPSAPEVAAILAAVPASFSYPEVGSTAQLDRIRDRYDVDHHQFVLGKGRELFARAGSALADWRHFEIPWIDFHRVGPVAKGQVVATAVGVAGIWLVNPCRVVYADFSSDPDSVAYAYGTLRGHAESGEERFLVSFDPSSGEVRYEISAFSPLRSFCPGSDTHSRAACRGGSPQPRHARSRVLLGLRVIPSI